MAQIREISKANASREKVRTNDDSVEQRKKDHNESKKHFASINTDDLHAINKPLSQKCFYVRNARNPNCMALDSSFAISCNRSKHVENGNI